MVAPFEDRLIPKLHAAAEKRRARDALRRTQIALERSVDLAFDLIGDRYRCQVADDPLAETEALNDVRRRASADLSSLREAVRLLNQRQRGRARRKRGALDGHDVPDHDDAFDGATGRLIGSGAAPAPLVDADMLAGEGYDIVETDDRRGYYRDKRLVFVEHRDRIDVHATDDEALRHALRLAQAKWGSVSAIGDGDFLDRVARLAVDEGITITNPELQDRITRMRNNRDLERHLESIEAGKAIPIIDQTPVGPILPVPPLAALADYAPDFTRWLEQRADVAIPRGRAMANAWMIFVNPELRRQLAELESQQFEFAIELRRAARRYLSWRQEVLAIYQAPWPDEPMDEFGRLPRLSDLKPDPEQLKRMGVEFAPLQSATGASIANEEGVPAKAATVNVETDSAREIDLRYRILAERDRRREREPIVRDQVAALRARVGDPAAPPHHVARLLLCEAVRARSTRSRSDRATDRRDRQESAALSRDPAFAQLLTRARGQEAGLIARLASVAPGDALGRVKVSRGRVDFAHVSEHGYNTGAQPPLEWIEADLRRIDFTRIRLTKGDGLIGLSDPDLLKAAHYNYVGLLYPAVQARLGVELRLQHERDRNPGEDRGRADHGVCQYRPDG